MTDRPETERVDALARALGDVDFETYFNRPAYTLAAAILAALTELGWTVERAGEVVPCDVCASFGHSECDVCMACVARRHAAALRGGPDATD